MKKIFSHILGLVVVSFLMVSCTMNDPNHGKFEAAPRTGHVYFNKDASPVPTIDGNTTELNFVISTSAAINERPLTVDYKLVTVNGPDINTIITNATGKMTIPGGQLNGTLNLKVDPAMLDTVLLNGQQTDFKIVLTSTNRDGVAPKEDVWPGTTTVELKYPECPLVIGTTYQSQTDIPDLGAPASAFASDQVTLTPTGDPFTYSVTNIWASNTVAVLAGVSGYPYPGIIKLDPHTLEVTVTGSAPYGPGGTGTYDPCSDTFDLTLNQVLFTSPFTVHVVLAGQ